MPSKSLMNVVELVKLKDKCRRPSRIFSVLPTSPGRFMRDILCMMPLLNWGIFIYPKFSCISTSCDDFLSTFELCDDKQCQMTSIETLVVAIVPPLREKNATRQHPR